MLVYNSRKYILNWIAERLHSTARGKSFWPDEYGALLIGPPLQGGFSDEPGLHVTAPSGPTGSSNDRQPPTGERCRA